METPFVLVLYGNKLVNLNWSKDDTADGYEVTIFGASGQSVLTQKTDAATISLQFSTDDYPFKSGGIYFVALRSWLNDQAGIWSEPVEFIINDLTLPVNMVTCEAGTVMANVSNPAVDAAVYTFQIQEKVDPPSDDNQPLAEVMAATKGLPLALSNQVTIGKIYQIMSELWVQNAVTEWTDYSEITIIDVAKPDVTVTYQDKIIHCSWLEISGADGYELELWTTGSAPQRIFQQTITAAPYAVDITEGFEEDQEYEVRLRAYQGSCFSTWDEKEIYTSSLSPVLKDLYDRLLAAYDATGNQSLTLDATTLGDPAAAVITLLNEQLGTDSIQLNAPVAIEPDLEHDQVLVNGVCLDAILGIDGSELAIAFGTEETKTSILVCLSLPVGSDWTFTQTFPTLSSTYIDSFTFDESQEQLPAFVLCSVDQPGTSLLAGLNFQGAVNVIGPLAALSALISSVGTTVPIVGSIVREGTSLTILLKGQVPDVTLDFTGFQSLSFLNPAFVFYVKQDVSQSYISLVRWVESDVTLSGVSIPLAVKLPDAISGWSVMLTPGQIIPLGNVPSFLGFIVGLDLSALLPDAIKALNCFNLTGFNLAFEKDQTSFDSLYLSINTDPSQKSLWPILPCLTFDQLDLQLSVYSKSEGGLAYNADILGVFNLNATLALQAQIVLPVGSGEWVFSCYSTEVIDSLAAISSLMNGADLSSYLPQGLGAIGQFELTGLTIAYDPQANKLTRLGIAIGSAAPWVLIADRLIIQRISLDMQMVNPFDSSRTVTGMVQGCLSIGQGGIEATVGKQTATSPWLFVVELVPGTMLTMVDIAGLAGITEQDIESFLPSQLSVLGSLALTEFYVEYDLTNAALTNVSFTIALTEPWDIYEDKIVVTSSSLSMSITPAAGTDAFAITAYIEGTIKLGDVSVVLDATNDQPNGNWIFRGNLDEGSVIVFNDIFTEVGLNGLPVPYNKNFPQSITITTFGTEITPAIPKFYFEAASEFEWDMDFALVTLSIKALNAELTLDNPADATQTIYLFKAGGSFVFCKINVDLALQISNGVEDSILFAELTNDNAAEVVVSDLSDTLTTNAQQGTSWSSLPLPTDLSTFGYVSAKLHVNLTQNTFILFGSSDKFGSIGFLTKKLDDTNWGYFVGLALADDFTFASICSSLSIIDSILSIRHAGFSVCSFEDDSVKQLTASMPEFKDVIVLPDGSNPAPLKPGLTIYGTIVFDGDLFGNVLKIISDLEEDSGITIYAFISKQTGQSIFKATVGTFSLFDAIQFEQIALTYQPQDPDDPTVTNKLLLTGTIKIIIDDDNQPTFANSLSISSQSASFSMATTEALHSPWEMFNVTLESLSLAINYTFSETTAVTIALTGTTGFGTPDPQGVHPVVLDGSVLFDNGDPVVCALSLAKALTVDDFLVTILPDNLWPTGWLDITFVEGSIYYAQKAGTYFEKPYCLGFNIDSTIDVYGLVFIITVQVQESGLIFTGRTNSAIDLIFAKLTAQDFSDTSPALEISTIGEDKKFGFLLGVQLFGSNIGTAEILYSITNQQFEGTVTYNGTILGTQNPSIRFAWNKEKGFQILDMPLELVSTVYDYAKRLDELSTTYSSGSGCGQLVGMAFDELMTTSYSVNVVSEGIVATEDTVTIPLNVTCTVKIAGQAILSQSLELPLVISKPREMTWQGFLDSLMNTVINSADAIVKKLLTDPDEFVEFIAAAGLQKMAQQTLTSLMCREVNSEQVVSQSEVEVDDGAAESETVAEGAEAGAEAAEAAATAAEAAAAGEVAVDAVPVLAGIVASLAGLVAGLLSLFGVDKSDEQKEAEANQQRAQEAAERVRIAVEAKLKRPAPTISYQSDDTITVSCKPVKGGGDLTYTFTLNKGSEQIGTQSQSGTSYTFSDDAIEPGETYTVKVQASLQAISETYTGDWSQNEITVASIPKPKNLNIIQVETNFLLNWQPGDQQSQTYTVRVKDNNGHLLNPQPQITMDGCQADINGSSLTHGAQYQFQIRAFNQDGHVFSCWSTITAVDSGMDAPQQITGNLIYKQDQSITLKSDWQAVTEADHYAVTVLDSAHHLIIPQPVITINDCEAIITCSAFTSGKTIFWRIGSQNSDNTQTVWSQDQTITFINLPVPTGMVLVYESDQDSVTAKWEMESEAVTYNFKLLDNEGQPLGGIQTGLTVAEAIVGGGTIVFEEGGLYQGQAKALADHADTVWSQAISITIIKLDAPTGLTLTYDQVALAVQATWLVVTEATAYEFELLDDQGVLVGQVQSVTDCQATVGGAKVPLEPGAIYHGQVRAKTSDCLGSWCTAINITIPKTDPVKELAQTLKDQGNNVYQAAEAIVQQLPDTSPAILAQDLYDVFQPPVLVLDDMAWALWFGQVNEADAQGALKIVYPESTDQELEQAIQAAWHPSANDLAEHLKLAAYTAEEALVKMRVVINNLDFPTATQALASAMYPLLDSAKALETSYTPKPLDLTQGLGQGFQLINQHGIAPMGAALNNAGLSLQETSGSMNNVYGTIWTIDAYSLILTIYNSAEWETAINDFNEHKTSEQTAVELKQAQPQMAVTDMDTILAAVFDLYKPHQSVEAMAEALKASDYSLTDASGGMKLLYQPDWTPDDYQIVLTVYNEN